MARYYGNRASPPQHIHYHACAGTAHGHVHGSALYSEVPQYNFVEEIGQHGLVEADAWGGRVKIEPEARLQQQ